MLVRDVGRFRFASDDVCGIAVCKGCQELRVPRCPAPKEVEFGDQDFLQLTHACRERSLSTLRPCPYKLATEATSSHSALRCRVGPLVRLFKALAGGTVLETVEWNKAIAWQPCACSVSSSGFNQAWFHSFCFRRSNYVAGASKHDSSTKGSQLSIVLINDMPTYAHRMTSHGDQRARFMRISSVSATKAGGKKTQAR